MPRPLASIDNVTKVYDNGALVTAVRDATIALHPAQIAALVGPSGSGKSTLLGLIGLLDRPTSGAILLDGQNAAGMSELARTRMRARLIGFVFQQFNLIGSLTARENVETALLYRGMRTTERRRIAQDALDRVGLGDRAHHRPNQLSGGEQQRVAMARAVVTGPRLIVADEPTGNLDSANASIVLDMLGEFASSGVAIVVATHDPIVAERAARTFVMRDGRLTERST